MERLRSDEFRRMRSGHKYLLYRIHFGLGVRVCNVIYVINPIIPHESLLICEVLLIIHWSILKNTKTWRFVNASRMSKSEDISMDSVCNTCIEYLKNAKDTINEVTILERDGNWTQVLIVFLINISLVIIFPYSRHSRVSGDWKIGDNLKENRSCFGNCERNF